MTAATKWAVAARLNSNATLRVHAEDGAKIADVLPSSKPGEQAERARLIAAAPELLALADRMEATLRSMLDGDTAARAGWGREYIKHLQALHGEAMRLTGGV